MTRNTDMIHSYLSDTYQMNESQIQEVINKLNYKRIEENHIEDGYYPSFNESVNLFNIDKKLQERLVKYLNAFTDEDFLVVNLETKEIYVRQFKLLPSELFDTADLQEKEVILFKIKPLKVQFKAFERMRKKGIKDVAPSFSDILKRAEGDIFRSLNRNPALVFCKDEKGKEHNYQIGGRNVGTMSHAYTLPKIRLVDNDFNKYKVPIFIMFDHIDRKAVGGSSNYAAILGALVGKRDDYKIDKTLLENLWNLSICILFSSLYTYGIKIDNLVVPSSMGKLVTFYRDAFKTYSPNTNIVTLKKPTLNQLESYYVANKIKYDKLFERMVIPSYEQKNVLDTYHPKDLFKMENNEYYPNIVYVPDAEYEERNDKTIKISKLPTGPHRQLMTKLMSDYILDSNFLPALKGSVILFDDDVITGSTLINFMYTTIKRSNAGLKNLYVVAMLSSVDNSLTDTNKLGIDKPLNFHDRNKNNTKEDKIKTRLNYLLTSLNSTENIFEFISEIESSVYTLFKTNVEIVFDTVDGVEKTKDRIVFKVKLPNVENAEKVALKDAILKVFKYIAENVEGNFDKEKVLSFLVPDED